MVVLAGRGDLARWVYYAGLILVVVALYTFASVTPWVLGVIGFGFLGVYLLIAIEVQRMTQPIVEPDVDLPRGVSVGEAPYPQDGHDGARPLQVADARTYDTKATHRQARGASVLPEVEGARRGMAQSPGGGGSPAGSIGVPVSPR